MVKAANPCGTLTRGLRLGRLGLTLTISYLGYQVQSLWLEPEGREERRRQLNQRASRQIREELQTLIKVVTEEVLQKYVRPCVSPGPGSSAGSRRGVSPG